MNTDRKQEQQPAKSEGSTAGYVLLVVVGVVVMFLLGMCSNSL